MNDTISVSLDLQSFDKVEKALNEFKESSAIKLDVENAFDGLEAIKTHLSGIKKELADVKDLEGATNEYLKGINNAYDMIDAQTKKIKYTLSEKGTQDKSELERLRARIADESISNKEKLKLQREIESIQARIVEGGNDALIMLYKELTTKKSRA